MSVEDGLDSCWVIYTQGDMADNAQKLEEFHPLGSAVNDYEMGSDMRPPQNKSIS